jgi:hypothetical protein
MTWVAAALVSVAPASALAQESRIPGTKSETAALLWSLLGTVVPAGAALLMAPSEANASNEGAVPSLVFLGSALIGPSLGHFYSGRSGRALTGIGIRTAALAAMIAGVAAAWNGNGGGDELMVAGLAVGGTVLAYDIIRAPHSARVHNNTIQAARIAVGLTHSSNGPRLGLGMTVSF